MREGNDTLWEKSRARDDAISETAVAGEVELESKTEHQQKIGAELTTESQQESVQEGVQENVQESTQDEIQELAVENDFVKKIMDKPGSVLADGGARRIRMCDSKWDQLWKIYPHIVPFRDEREYISITPGDFVVLPAKYFRLTNNSFLLHGYYNYKHLVLSRMEVRGEEKYYIGVPGTFFEREKQVAVMFGFESFECMEEPACAGDYGYYMMKIEL